MSIENPTLAHFRHFRHFWHFRHFSSLFTNLRAYKAPSTFVENPLQIDLFMQDKPNVKYAKMNVSSFITSKYVKVDTW